MPTFETPPKAPVPAPAAESITTESITNKYYENFMHDGFYVDLTTLPISKIETDQLLFVTHYKNILNVYVEQFDKAYANHAKNSGHMAMKTATGDLKKLLFNRGLNCVYTVFSYYMSITNHVEFTVYHAEKAAYYFTEFLAQIVNKNNFVTLTCSDAVLFVYKKTIYKLKKRTRSELSRLYSEEITTLRTKTKLILKILTFVTECGATDHNAGNYSEFVGATNAETAANYRQHTQGTLENRYFELEAAREP